MPSFYDPLPAVTIPNGTAVSNIVSSKTFSDAIALTLYAPATLDAFTFTIEVCEDEDATTSSTWRTYQLGDTPADVSPPLAGKARVYPELATVGAFRLKSSSNVAADRTWAASKAWNMV